MEHASNDCDYGGGPLWTMMSEDCDYEGGPPSTMTSDDFDYGDGPHWTLTSDDCDYGMDHLGPGRLITVIRNGWTTSDHV